MAQQSKATQVFFCTYKNAETQGKWRKSYEYHSVDELVDSMKSYLSKYPTTTVQFQYRLVYSLEGAQ